MQHDHAKIRLSEQGRAPWVQPVLTRLHAGSAELLAAIQDDGPGDKS